MNKINLDEHVKQVLEKSREVYGAKNQILVSIEELNELACILAKYPRYNDENEGITDLYQRVLDEVADVTIILDHVRNIFRFNDYEIDDRIRAKIARLSRWLSHSDSMQETIDDRKVESLCKGCVNENRTGEEFFNFCSPCYQSQATEGIAINYTKEN